MKTKTKPALRLTTKKAEKGRNMHTMSKALCFTFSSIITLSLKAKAALRWFTKVTNYTNKTTTISTTKNTERFGLFRPFSALFSLRSRSVFCSVASWEDPCGLVFARSAAFAFAVAFTAALSGCAIPTLENTQRITHQASDTADANIAKIDRALALNKAASNEMEQIKSNWLGGHRIKTARALPPVFSTNITLTQDFDSPQSLIDCLQTCAGMPGIPVQLTNDNTAQTQATQTGAPTAANPIVPSLSGIPPGMPGAMPGMQGLNSTSNTSASINRIIHIRYTGGTYKGLLDQAAFKLGGIGWKYSDNTNSVEFYSVETKTITIDTVPGNSNTAASISSGGGSGGSSGGSAGGSSGGSSSSGGPSASINSSMSVWDDLKGMMPIILSPTGKFFISPATGTITITDKPSYVKVAEEKINAFNAILGMQALIQVKIYKVTLNDGDQYGINWNIVFNSLSKNTGLTFANAFPVNGATGSFAANILKTAGATNPNANIGALAGSSVMLNALSTQGRATSVTSASGTTTNNHFTSIKVGNDISYPSTSTNVATANVGTTTSLTPAKIQTGFIMTALPHIISDHEMYLQYAFKLNSNTMDVQVNNGVTTKYPNIAGIDSMQLIKINSGETLILSGFEQTSGNMNQQGTGNASNWIFGGGVNASKTKDIVVIMITPIIAEKAQRIVAE